MPHEHLPEDAELDELLERVRARFGMATRDEAAEFLIRRRLRKAAQRTTGRGRALHAVRGGKR